MIHRITHKHAIARKPGVGEVLLCSTRITDNIKGIWYRTPLENAEWVQMPVDMDVYVKVLQSTDYMEAVAHIRQAWRDEWNQVQQEGLG